MSARICPRCGQNDVRQSGRNSVGDSLLACFGLAPYRCRACRARFFRMPAGHDSRLQIAEPVRVDSVSEEPAPPLTLRALADHPLTMIPIAFSILIVSRDPAIRRLLCRLLERPAYHTHQLSESGQIPGELRARKVDLVITDLAMPEQQGLENVAALRTLHPNLKIIALSGLRIAGVPGLIVLPKPFGREVLLETVQSALVEAAHARVPGR
jgi:CheY-like chemotaxis protein